jgi:hypothetical protein
MRISGAYASAAIALSTAALVLPLGAHATRSAVKPCSPQVHHGVLPVWMRGGFGAGARPRIPYVTGLHRAIGGVLFAFPLDAPPARHMNNKILWVPRHLAKDIAPMWIKMQKMEGRHLVGPPVRRIIANGPGPSYMDAPSAGCWRLTLTWSGQRDTLDLRYVPPLD